MKKKLLIILFFLIAVPVVLYAFSKVTKKSPQQTPQVSTQNEQIPTKKPANQQTTLTFSPNPYTLTAASGSVAIVIDTGTNNATAVQLELSYDPKILTNVAITPGTFFQNPIELIKKVNTTTGKLSYAFGAALNAPAKTGKGTIAIITFTSNLQKGQQTSITLLPQTIVTAEKEESSVLKPLDNTTVTITNP